MDSFAAQAAELGIDTEYVDARGKRRRVPQETLRRLVVALAPPEKDAATQHVAPVVWRKKQPAAAETGTSMDVPAAVPPGIYQLTPHSKSKAGAGHPAVNVIVAPEQAYQLEGVAQDHVWVLAVQLYAVRSHRNWGHGDFSDLLNLVRIAASNGAAGIGLNPLHALFDDRPEQASPYSPNSRLFLNPLYIDVEAVPEFPGLSANGLRDDLDRLGAGELVDYTRVAAAKLKGLRAAYAAFRKKAKPERRAAFNAFRKDRGAALSRFAAFEVLRRRLQNVWWEWPEEWRRPTDAALERLRAEAEEEIGYYEFLQWVADEQLGACNAEAERLGLPIGLYIDLAVGVEPGGADAWSDQDSVIPQVEVGAPPDLLNTAGQAWGVAAFNPRALEREVFAPFIQLLHAAMRHAGAIRLDHVLGLNRLYLIPFGCKPQEGAYVRYPLQSMLAIVALESVRERCLVIGEDLGTVPEELRDILADWGIWSYLVMLFERGEGGQFKPPQEYRRNALVTFSTHDLPTYEGWRSSHDLRVKRALGLDPGETDDERDRARWLYGEALGRSRVSEDRHWDFLDVLRFLARSPSRLLVVEIDDVLGLADQPNIPGTMDEHPNWRRRLPVVLEDLENDERLRAIAAVLREEGRSSRRR